MQWNDFQDNGLSPFKDLKDNQDLSDVTLSNKDGQNIEAHGMCDSL